MRKNNIFIRTLSAIEQAFTISNESSPLSVVCVLELASRPDQHTLQMALNALQSRHLLLQAGITIINGKYAFQQQIPAPPITLNIANRIEANSWRSISENALNTTFDKSGPLMKCWHLQSPQSTNSEIILCFHHAIIDSIAARLILHELLCFLGGISLPEPSRSMTNAQFPPAFRKGNFIKWLLPFVGRQLKEEWLYKSKGMTSPIPAHSNNAIISLQLSPAISRKLSLRIGREGLSLNSVLLAAMALAVGKYKHSNTKAQQARLISFVDLRPSLFPPVSPLELGCYVSMIRLNVPMASDQSALSLATHIRKAIFKSSRLGDVFGMAKVSKYLIKMTLRMQNARLGLSALSFIGKLDLEPQYGSIQLRHVAAFITNNRFGPELSAFGKILFGAISLDFTYLTAEWDAKQAKLIVQEISEMLEKLAN